MKIIAATGHRPQKLGGYGAHVDSKLRGLAQIWLQNNRPDGVISGMALGWDMAFAEAAIMLGITLHAAVPFRGQQSVWPCESQERYQQILNCARSITVVCEGDYAAHKMQVRNEWMVDRATRVLALWDGTPGGTHNCVMYAHRQQKPIVNLWQTWLGL